MGRKEGIPDRQYTQEFKVEAVRLAESIGGNQAAKRLAIPDSSIWNWIRLSRSGKLKGVDATELEAENARLRRELAEAKLDLEVVKKAAVYFARGSR
jgi:transposase